MFYSSYLFVKKGPLAGLWLAAHWQRKLTKVMIEKTNLLKAKHAIEQPETPLALRVSGQLLLGLVRIYDKKVRYLQEDCSEAITSLKQAYRAGRPGAVDSVNLPADAQQGAHINLPDQGDDDVPIALPDIDIDELLRDHSAAQLDDDLYGIPMKKKRSRSKKKSDTAAAEEEEETDQDSVIMSSTKQKARAADITMEDFNLSQSSHPLILGDEDLLDGIGVLRDDELEIEVGRDDAQQSRIEDEMMIPLEMEEDVPVGKADQSAINLADISIAESNRPSMIPTSPEREDEMENKYEEAKSNNKRPREQLTEEEELLDIQMDVVDDDALQAVTDARIKAKPVKKQRIERVDASTEISGKDMAKWIADPSDLVRPRPTVPCTRAQRMLQDITNLPDHFNHSSTHPHLPSELTSLLTLASSRTLKKLSTKEIAARIERARMWRSTLGYVDEEDAKTVVPDDMIEPIAEEEVVIPTESDVIVDEGDMIPLNDSLDIDATEDIPAPPIQPERDEDIQSIRSYDDSVLQADATRDEENAGAARQFFSEKSEPVEEDGNETADEAMEQDQKKQQQVGTDLSQRTKKMHSLLNKMMTKTKSTETTLDAVIQTAPKNQRHIAAIVFQQLLVLKTHDFVDVEQSKPYDDITISQTATFKKAFTGRPIAA